MNPPQQFPHRPSPHMKPVMPLMHGNPKGQFATNQFFHPPNNRPRNPNVRTSRAANLTEEEERAVLKELGILERAGEDKVIEQQNLPVQGIQMAMKSSNAANVENFNPAWNQAESKQEKVSQEAPELAVLDSAENKKEGSDQAASAQDSSHNRQQREMSFDRDIQMVRKHGSQPDVASNKESDVADDNDLAIAESIQVENFVQDQLPEEIGEAGVVQNESSLYHNASPLSVSVLLDSSHEEGGPGEASDDLLESSKRKILGEQKAKPEMVGNEQDSRFEISAGVKLSASMKRTSDENKKSFAKMKSGKDKSELHQQQQFAKTKTAKSDKGQEKMQGQSHRNPEEVQEQQEFVAPKVVQRGFHPILPYSEKDPGPILVQMSPKVEKFLPPTMGLAEDGNAVKRPENGASLPIVQADNTNLLNSNGGNAGTLGSASFNQVQPDPLLFVNKHLGLVPSTLSNKILHVPIAHQAPFRSLTHNHLTTV